VHRPPQITPESWYRLRLFNYLRGSIALFFIIIYMNGWLVRLVINFNLNSDLFLQVSLSYLFASIVFGLMLYLRKPGLDAQVMFQTVIDIACIVMLMHAVGSIRTGLGTLLIINISMTSLFLHRRLTILFAAIAALAIIAEQVVAQIVFNYYTPAYTQAGLLGVLIFIAAIISSFTAERLKSTEKRAEQANLELESAVQLNEHIIQNMRTGILVVENNGKLLMANNAALELLGKSDNKGVTNLEQLSPKLYQRFLDWHYHVEQSLQPIKQSQGLPDIQPGFSSIDKAPGKAISHERRTLIFLEDATQLAQRFQQVKLASLGRLTASIAHEIRNPLAAINHAGQLLAETSDTDADRKLTGIINTQVKRLNGIVENVLQLSRQQNGSPERIVMNAFLKQFRDEFVDTYKLKKEQMPVSIEPPDVAILFDQGQLHQVLWNLASNALNHSGKDTGELCININGGIDANTSHPYLDIIDNGKGIPDDILENIFDPFFTTSSTGNGLGLYITKEIIENNRAKLRYIRPDSGGACFRLSFQHSLSTP
jgi:two-component system sensor histidine kinase PilS (NtrC family)